MQKRQSQMTEKGSKRKKNRSVKMAKGGQEYDGGGDG